MVSKCIRLPYSIHRSKNGPPVSDSFVSALCIIDRRAQVRTKACARGLQSDACAPHGSQQKQKPPAVLIEVTTVPVRELDYLDTTRAKAEEALIAAQDPAASA